MDPLEAKRVELAHLLEQTQRELTKLRDRQLRLQGGLTVLEELIQQRDKDAHATAQTD